MREDLLEAMDPDEIVAAADTLDIDDLAELMGDLPDTVADEVLKSMGREDRERLEHMLSYEEGTAGRLLNPDLVTVRADVTVDVVLRYLRQRAELPEQSHHLYVVNRRGQYQGRMPFAQPADRRSVDAVTGSWTSSSPRSMRTCRFRKSRSNSPTTTGSRRRSSTTTTYCSAASRSTT